MNKLWPQISIVTPSLNQGDFIEETIQSILSQNYPNLEYLVVDGGSTDHTLSVLEKYSDQINLISEPDHGQSNAINKGLQLVSGEILAYLNADDILLPESLFTVADIFIRNPGVNWVTGRCKIIDENGNGVRGAIYNYKNVYLILASYNLLFVTNYISQPATFWRRKLLDNCGLFDEELNYVMDYDYWLRAWKYGPPFVYHRDLAAFRIQPSSKTTSMKQLAAYASEENAVVNKHSTSKFWDQMHGMHRMLMSTIYKFMNS